MGIQNMPTTKRRLANVKQTAELYPAFSEDSIRAMIFNSHRTGIGSCISRIGRKIVIDLDGFEAWVDSRTVTKKSTQDNKTDTRPPQRKVPKYESYDDYYDGPLVGTDLFDF